MATYAGDSIHAPAQTPITSLTVTPLRLQAIPSPAVMLYGAPLPPLTGSLVGLLPQDASRVTASFTTPATPSSPVGSYPISVTLTRAAAPNYALVESPVNLVISQAPTATVLADNTVTGSAVASFLVQVNSATTHTPSGHVILLDNGSSLATAVLNTSGSATFSQLTLPTGSHTLSATYLGDGNFSPSTSFPLAEVIAPAPVPPASDFTIAASGASSQTLVGGSSVAYTLSIKMIAGGPPSPINFVALWAASVRHRLLFRPTTFRLAPPLQPLSSSPSPPLPPQLSVIPHPKRSLPSAIALVFPLLGILLERRKASSPMRGNTFALTLLTLAVAVTLSGCGDRVSTSAAAGAAFAELQPHSNRNCDRQHRHSHRSHGHADAEDARQPIASLATAQVRSIAPPGRSPPPQRTPAPSGFPARDLPPAPGPTLLRRS